MFDKTVDRRLSALRVIVSNYVEAQEPVGSKSLVERYSLGVSVTTTHNDMVTSEEEGLVRQPHASVGRVPTGEGYRFFVDQIDQTEPPSTPEHQTITEFFLAVIGLDDIVKRAVRLSAHPTWQTTVIELPAFRQSILRHLGLVGMGAESIRRVLVVVTAFSGRVDRVLVSLPCGTTQSESNNLARPLEGAFTTPETPDGARSESTPGAGMAPRETEETPSRHAPQHESTAPCDPQ